MKPGVTFIVTCYNYAAYVEQAVDSLLGQTYQDLEVIVINDASPDNSREVLARYEGNPRVQVITHETNKGHIYSYNEGIALARGEYIGVLAADDFALRPDAVAREVAIFESNPRVGFTYGAHELVDSSGKVFDVARPFETDYVIDGRKEFARLVWLNYVPHSGTLVRRVCHDELGVYDPRLPHSGDWDLWLRVATRYDVGYVADPLYAYRVHDSNMSHARVSPAQAIDELLLTLKKNFDLLQSPDEAPLRALERRALKRALFIPLWIDLAHGRTKRTWQGLIGALSRQPLLLGDRAFLAACLRTVALTTLGWPRYRKMYGGYAR
jgi:glycosyltransferase involved in cell wall biosynthesis